MWVEGPHAGKRKKSTNDELELVEGTLTDAEAQVWFAKYCLANPSFMVYILTRVELDPVQDLLLRAFFLKDYCLVVAGRGFSKSFVISLFCILYALAHPEVKIGIASGTFRQSKSIMQQIETFASHPKNGTFLRSCITKELTKSTDAWRMEIGYSSITAIPLGKVRGYRFNVLIVDELLVVSKDILDSVLKPFLMVRQDGPKHDQIAKAQKILVENGVIKPEEVESFFQNNKIIGLSSASFKFESLYRDNYVPYVKTILDPESKDVNHCVFRLSYRAAPKAYMEESAIEDMRRTMSTSMFNRELEAIFSDDSGGFFSAQKMEEATIPLGEYPTVKLVGDSNKKYVLAIDPNYSNSETADDFAMAVLELNEEDESATLVHAYALPNSTNEARCLYLKYLLEYFNIVYIIVDNSGGPAFLQIAKEFKMLPRNLDLFEHDFLNFNFQEGLAFTKQNFSSEQGKIVHSQAFGIAGWIRIANENLQAMIERKKIKFAAPIFHDSDFSHNLKLAIPMETLHFSKAQNIVKDSSEEMHVLVKTSADELKADFIEHLSDMVNLTKKECSLIELTASINGHHQYDLPPSMKRDSNPKRARRDSYTALLLGAWGVKCYYDLNKQEPQQAFIFSPRMFR
jgi:hypothetical protein